ncbi:hypothetical protein B4589_009850 [Halolamina sp. CBA1230]|uniref:hypothetical protein n=1 Tax=Halolamina sp. CBA1230 TaxID=1853690 RepID=UPI0009A17F4C|nr:hypothetical protein [Halolamina sp. CBA1230]QKY20667.1 hypothetical protein B4589_009850 [Halolamina sp. CBA1230]
MKGHRIVAFLFAVALVVSPPAGIVGTASATHDCDGLDNLVAAVSAGVMASSEWVTGAGAEDGVNYDKCGRNHTAHVVEDIEKSDGNQTHLDIYQGAVAQASLAQSYHDVQTNVMNRYGSLVWSDGMAAYAECYEAGRTKAHCEAEMRSTIADKIAFKQRNIVEESDKHVAALDALRNRSEMEEDLTSNGVFGKDDAFAYQYPANASESDAVGKAGVHQTVVHYDVQLANGSTQEADYIVAIDPRSGANYQQYLGAAPESMVNGQDTDQIPAVPMVVAPPNDNYDYRDVYDPDKYHSKLTELKKTNSRLQDNVGKFSNSTWDALESGKIDASDLITHGKMVSDYSSKYSETGYYVHAVAALSQLGLETPNLNETAHMTIRYDDAKHTGLLLSDTAPSNGSWVVGETYNASEIDGLQMFVTQQGTKIELSGEFELAAAQGPDGDEKSTVETRKTNYVTTDATEVKKVIERTEVTRKVIETREPDGTGVVPSGDDLPVDWRVLAGGIVALIIVVYLLRSAITAKIKY